MSLESLALKLEREKEKEKPPAWADQEGVVAYTYYNPNAKRPKRETVYIDTKLKPQHGILTWQYNENGGATPVLGETLYAVNKGWLFTRYLTKIEEENEFGVVSP